ncbi:winged helix-turn-helix domain-containing protein [Actinoplanes sp. DH11]|uniref:AfsR/SARP family transcriptional regulator n=1 Tax=Actinoplanes sp. DH11 TaxID=2857011 RepID=UPI001E514404|nr:winged helix-turn-helix domain-containing protein [Actinoplanes sp. DH11]
MTDGSSAGALRVEILGPVRAFRGAEPVDLGPVKQQAVLALLLLNAGTPLPITHIVAALWGSDPPENGVDAVQRYIGGLRRALDPQRTALITLTPEGYVLRAGACTVDADHFRATVARARAEHRTGDIGAATDEVRRALAGRRHEPLAGLTGTVFASARARLQAELSGAADLLTTSTAPPPADPPQAPADWPHAPADAPPPTRVMPPVSTGPMPAAHTGPMPAAHTGPMPAAHTGPMPAAHTGPMPAAHTGPIPAAHTRPMPPVRSEPAAADPDYPEAVDPWAGHELFPPDQLPMN